MADDAGFVTTAAAGLSKDAVAEAGSTACTAMGETGAEGRRSADGGDGDAGGEDARGDEAGTQIVSISGLWSR